MVKNRYKNNLQDFGSLANYWIFIQNGALLPTGISFPIIIFHNDAYLLSMTTSYNSTSLFLLPSFSGAYQGNPHKN